MWQIECTANHNASEKCGYESDESDHDPSWSIISGVGRPLKGRNYVSYTFQEQGCLRQALASSKCSGWSPPVTLRWPAGSNPASGG